MNLRKALDKACVIPSLHAEDKHGVLCEMVERLVAASRLAEADRETVLHALWQREKKMSTGMQYGLAIPHAKTDAVDRLVVALALKPEGLPFDALDGQPSRIFVMTLSPLNRTGPHIQFLAEISRLLNDPAVRERLLAAKTAEDMLSLF